MALFVPGSHRDVTHEGGVTEEKYLMYVPGLSQKYSSMKQGADFERTSENHRDGRSAARRAAHKGRQCDYVKKKTLDLYFFLKFI